jgi:hypothetical protein
VFFDKFGEIVEAGCYMWESTGAPFEHDPDGDVPMARVRKQKPTAEPKYPTSGKIHIFEPCCEVSRYRVEMWLRQKKHLTSIVSFQNCRIANGHVWKGSVSWRGGLIFDHAWR